MDEEKRSVVIICGQGKQAIAETLALRLAAADIEPHIITPEELHIEDKITPTQIAVIAAPRDFGAIDLHIPKAIAVFKDLIERTEIRELDEKLSKLDIEPFEIREEENNGLKSFFNRVSYNNQVKTQLKQHKNNPRSKRPLGYRRKL